MRLDKKVPEVSLRRDWRKYSKEILLAELSLVDWSSDVNNVQNMWDAFESKLVKVVDNIAPLTEFSNNKVKTKIPNIIKHKINKRNRLLKLRKTSPNDEIKLKLNSLNAEIKTYYYTQKRNSVRKDILPGNSRSLWSAVNISKDIGSNEIPNNMYCNEKKIPEKEVANCFAAYFEEKVDKIVKNATIDPDVYNGKTKFVAADDNFMSPWDVLECAKQLKIKNCEGYDGIPQCFLIDGISIIFSKINQS